MVRGCRPWRQSTCERKRRVRGSWAEAKKVARRQLIAFNKASDAAQVVRREYLTKLLTRKTPPKGAAELTARVMIAGGAGSRQVSDHEVKSLAAELLGETGYGSSWADKPMTAGRAQVIALAYALAAPIGWDREQEAEERDILRGDVTPDVADLVGLAKGP